MLPAEFARILNTNCPRLGLRLEQSHLEQLWKFTEILLGWNQKLHLVSKKDATPARVVRQIVDSLLILHYFDIPQKSRLLDVGTGAGFPAIPIKLVRPDLKMVLTESLHKKIPYLQSLIEELGLSKAVLFAGRTKDLPNQYLNHFDFATAKASGALAEVWTEVYVYLKKGGALLIYKGQKVKSEVEDAQGTLKKYPGEITGIQEIKIEELDLGGYLVCMRKK